MTKDKRQAPLTKTFKVSFPETPGLEAELIALNQGVFPRSATGFLFMNGELRGNVTAELPEAMFEEDRGRGAPSKTARNVAISCAAALFYRRNEAQGVIAARNKVIDLWRRQGFTGLKVEKHVRDREKDCRDALSQAVVRVVKFFDGGPSLVMVFERTAKWSIQRGVAAVHGPGWSWIEGNERAQYGNFKALMFEWSVPHEDDTFGDTLRSAITGHQLADFVMFP